MRTISSPVRSLVAAAASLAMLLTAATAFAQQPKPLGSDLVAGKAGEFGHFSRMGMLLNNGSGFDLSISQLPGFTGSEVAVADVNGDNADDIVVVQHTGQVFLALSGVANFLNGIDPGDFTSTSPFVEGPNNCCERTRVLRLADVNNDDNLDIVVTMWSKMAVKLGNGDGTFGSAILSNATGFDARGMGVGDLDGDGNLDLAAVHAPGAWWVAYHKGNGDGTFQAGVILPGSQLAIPNVFIADAEGDGDLDIFTGALGARLKLFRNGGAANFTVTTFDAGSGMQGSPLVVDDFNGDERPDVVAGIDANGFTTVRIWFSDGSGGYTTADHGPVGVFPFHGVVADVNKDGIKDVAMATAGTGNGGVWILRGTGPGTFAAPYGVPGFRNNYTIAAGNFTKPADTTPPVITPTVTGALNGGWYTSNVTVSWAVADAESAITGSTGCTTQTVSSDTAGTTFTCTATSGGGTSSRSVKIQRDTTAPAIASATADPSVLWAPNNKMRAVTVSVSASDAGSGGVVCSVTSVSSSEGGSVHEPDVELTSALTLNLRAEREGKGTGRTYVAQISCKDAAGNTSTSTAAVGVPHDQGKK